MSDVIAFNTVDIFKRLAPSLSSEMIILQQKIDAATAAIQHHSVNDLQQQMDGTKSTLSAAKDSPQRKKLVTHITELDSKVTSLLIPYENLNQQAAQLITLFKTSPNRKLELNGLLETLQTKSAPFLEEHKRVKEQLNTIAEETGKLTGTPVEAAALSLQHQNK